MNRHSRIHSAEPVTRAPHGRLKIFPMFCKAGTSWTIFCKEIEKFRHGHDSPIARDLLSEEYCAILFPFIFYKVCHRPYRRCYRQEIGPMWNHNVLGILVNSSDSKDLWENFIRLKFLFTFQIVNYSFKLLTEVPNK